MYRCVIAAVAVIASVNVYIDGSASEPCDLSGTQECIGEAAHLVPGLYFNPLDADLIADICTNHCDKSFGTCMQLARGNCSANSLSPYYTIVNTAAFLCSTDLTTDVGCLWSPDVQRSFGYCFRIFRVIVDDDIRDQMSEGEMSNALCSAYNDVTSCCQDAAMATCDRASRYFIADLVYTAALPNRLVLGC